MASQSASSDCWWRYQQSLYTTPENWASCSLDDYSMHYQQPLPELPSVLQVTVHNQTWDFSIEYLHQLLSVYGAISGIHILSKSPFHALVQYQLADCAIAAISYCNGLSLYYGYNNLEVQFSTQQIPLQPLHDVPSDWSKLVDRIEEHHSVHHEYCSELLSNQVESMTNEHQTHMNTPDVVVASSLNVVVTPPTCLMNYRSIPTVSNNTCEDDFGKESNGNGHFKEELVDVKFTTESDSWSTEEDYFGDFISESLADIVVAKLVRKVELNEDKTMKRSEMFPDSNLIAEESQKDQEVNTMIGEVEETSYEECIYNGNAENLEGVIGTSERLLKIMGVWFRGPNPGGSQGDLREINSHFQVNLLGASINNQIDKCLGNLQSSTSQVMESSEVTAACSLMPKEIQVMERHYVHQRHELSQTCLVDENIRGEKNLFPLIAMSWSDGFDLKRLGAYKGIWADFELELTRFGKSYKHISLMHSHDNSRGIGCDFVLMDADQFMATQWAILLLYRQFSPLQLYLTRLTHSEGEGKVERKHIIMFLIQAIRVNGLLNADLSSLKVPATLNVEEGLPLHIIYKSLIQDSYYAKKYFPVPSWAYYMYYWLRHGWLQKHLKEATSLVDFRMIMPGISLIAYVVFLAIALRFQLLESAVVPAINMDMETFNFVESNGQKSGVKKQVCKLLLLVDPIILKCTVNWESDILVKDVEVVSSIVASSNCDIASHVKRVSSFLDDKGAPVRLFSALIFSRQGMYIGAHNDTEMGFDMGNLMIHENSYVLQDAEHSTAASKRQCQWYRIQRSLRFLITQFYQLFGFSPHHCKHGVSCIFSDIPTSYPRSVILEGKDHLKGRVLLRPCLIEGLKWNYKEIREPK